MAAKLTRLRLDIPAERTDLIRAVKVRAGLEGKTIADVACDALGIHLAEEIKQVKRYKKEA